MKKHLWLAPFACALSLAAPFSQPIFAQNAIPDIRDTQPDGKAAKFIVFDGPDACTPGGTPGPPGQPIGIDANDTVVAGYQECGRLLHYGFYRLADGAIHDFHPYSDYPYQPYEVQGAVPTAMNAEGTIVGTSTLYGDGTYCCQTVFIRDRAGNYIEFTPTNDTDNLRPTAISSLGAITGSYYSGARAVTEGFLRDTKGNTTSFEAPGNGPVTGTFPTALNSKDTVVGYTNYYINSYQTWGFLRHSDGSMTILDPQQSDRVIPVAITDDGSVVGTLDTLQVFLRDPHGNYTYFTVPLSGLDLIYPMAVDPQGSIVGSYGLNESASLFGFYRLRDGKIGYFNPPGSVFTYPTAISSKGDIAGYFLDASYAQHYFIRINPDPPAASAAQNDNTSVEPAQ